MLTRSPCVSPAPGNTTRGSTASETFGHLTPATSDTPGATENGDSNASTTPPPSITSGLLGSAGSGVTTGGVRGVGGGTGGHVGQAGHGGVSGSAMRWAPMSTAAVFTMSVQSPQPRTPLLSQRS